MQQISLRFTSEELVAIEALRRDLGDISRNEAVRYILDLGLAAVARQKK